MSLYFYILLFSGIVPFLYSFEKKMSFYKKWPVVFLAIVIVMIPFVIWDVSFTSNGYWGFNEAYISGYYIFSLPVEEVLFFVVIPYVCVFTYYALKYYFPHLKVSLPTTRIVSYALLVLSLLAVVVKYDLPYTRINALFLLIVLGYAVAFKLHLLQVYLWVFLVLLVPFFVVNGILTGFGIEDEVVWYHSDVFLGLRIFTIPIEDAFYAFSMILANLLVIDRIEDWKWVQTKKGS